MDIKEVGGTIVIVVGGAAYTFSQVGLGSALSEELRHIDDVPRAERTAYMESITREFADSFETYHVQTEDYVFIGNSKFSTRGQSGMFVEVVTQSEPVPGKHLKNLQDSFNEQAFCAQPEMTMFTENGWHYRFTVTDSRKAKIVTLNCRANTQQGSV